MSNFVNQLQDLINRHSKENGSNTPDYILAQYLSRCLDAFDEAVTSRDYRNRQGEPSEQPAQTKGQ